MEDLVSGTPGGAKLRALRDHAGMTQLQVELDADLGTGYLQRLESGRVRQPVRATLERILDALGARFSERREVLEVFGYLVRVSLPDAGEKAWAASVAGSEIHRFPFPAYLLDCSHRLILWNRIFPRLLGPSGERLVLEKLTGGSFLATWFDPASPLSRIIIDPDRLLPALLRAFRHEMRQFQYEVWYPALLAELNALESFRHYWGVVEQEEAPAAAARALVPIRLNVPDAGEMRFRLSAEQFTRDTRFRIIYYFPTDAATIEICEQWNLAAPGTPQAPASVDQAIGPT
jgi:transcriptional regulator with XRE-family HTH domain